MAVHTISFTSAVVLLLVAVLLLYLIGPLALLLAILGVFLLWWALGPGSRQIVVTTP
ncbi:MAG: hypothetical protein L3K16_06520 [Thermoplasmata archaeon]|nr:hypothetical protein [Thermoplasmata archaeon]